MDSWIWDKAPVHDGWLLDQDVKQWPAADSQIRELKDSVSLDSENLPWLPKASGLFPLKPPFAYLLIDLAICLLMCLASYLCLYVRMRVLMCWTLKEKVRVPWKEKSSHHGDQTFSPDMRWPGQTRAQW